MQEIEEERSQCLAELIGDNQTSGTRTLSSILGLQANVTHPPAALLMPFILISDAEAERSLQLTLSSYIRKERNRYFKA